MTHKPSDEEVASVERFVNGAGLHPPEKWKNQISLLHNRSDTILQISDSLVFRMRGGVVQEFMDQKQNLRVLAAIGPETDFDNCYNKPTVITETQAVQITRHFLTSLGFDGKRFELEKVDHFDLRPRALPTSYVVHWVGARPVHASSGLPAQVNIEISGADGNLVSYWYSPNTLGFGP